VIRRSFVRSFDGGRRGGRVECFFSSHGGRDGTGVYNKSVSLRH
jgi:hypothetical protein